MITRRPLAASLAAWPNLIQLTWASAEQPVEQDDGPPLPHLVIGEFDPVRRGPAMGAASLSQSGILPVAAIHLSTSF